MCTEASTAPDANMCGVPLYLSMCQDGMAVCWDKVGAYNYYYKNYYWAPQKPALPGQAELAD